MGCVTRFRKDGKIKTRIIRRNCPKSRESAGKKVRWFPLPIARGWCVKWTIFNCRFIQTLSPTIKLLNLTFQTAHRTAHSKAACARVTGSPALWPGKLSLDKTRAFGRSDRLPPHFAEAKRPNCHPGSPRQPPGSPHCTRRPHETPGGLEPLSDHNSEDAICVLIGTSPKYGQVGPTEASWCLRMWRGSPSSTSARIDMYQKRSRRSRSGPEGMYPDVSAKCTDVKFMDSNGKREVCACYMWHRAVWTFASAFCGGRAKPTAKSSQMRSQAKAKPKAKLSQRQSQAKCKKPSQPKAKSSQMQIRK